MQNIAKKLLAIQQKNVFIPKTGKNPFTKSNYRKLEDILTVMKPILTEHNILLLQTNTSNVFSVILYDIDSGELVESKLEIPTNPDPQKVGAMITYFTRYGLSGLLGLEVADDVDGENAKNKGKDAGGKENRLKVVEHIKTRFKVKTNAEVEARLSALMGRPIKLAEYSEAEAKNDLLTLLK